MPTASVVMAPSQTAIRTKAIKPMQANWRECIEFTLSFEGGYDANPKDRGNWTSGVIGKGELKGTKYGIAAHVYPTLDIKSLTKQDATRIYEIDYWPKVDGPGQPSGVDLVAWDICVNSGAARALAIEAKTLGSTIKTATGLAALARSRPDKVAIVKSMCAIRAAFYRGLSSFQTFGRGWLRRNAAAEAKGVTMALRGAAATPEQIKTRLEAEGKAANNSAKASGMAAGGAGAGTAAPAGHDGAWVTDWGLNWATAGKVAIVLALIALAIYFGRKFIQHRERSRAYAAAAQG